MSELDALSIDQPSEALLRRFLELLLETNRSFNLTAITDPAEAWTKHVLDSLTLLPDLRELAAGSRVIDVGSGGGLPALPLATVLPALQFTLLEATAKKARFLESAARELGLRNVSVVCDRAEAYGGGPERERFDAATSRAVSRLPVLLELTVPLLKVGGLSLSIKGEQAATEVDEAKNALTVLKATVEDTRRTPTGVVIRIRKTGPTPAKYPRRSGEPKRAPL
ncbi:MAG TPA: 16S rRNA (guanine(527)-N(7))-methyltransferase RsmG [Polyangiales bacterium]|nr:16S rRNA (guanine(527)-N(7))-methyltransferase RsmG [Polyangiales bacterium]